MTRIVFSLVALVGVMASLPVAAQDADPKSGLRDLSITISPLHLVLPVVELTGEYRVNDNLGVAGLVGFGQVTTGTTTTIRDGDTTTPSTSTTEDITVTVFEVGAQVRYYLIGDFEHGMQIGAEALYLYAAAEDSADPSISGQGNGLALGPFIGYKVVTDGGFTFDSQLGIQAILVSADASDSDTGESSSDSESSVLPLLNLNIGWTF